MIEFPYRPNLRVLEPHWYRNQEDYRYQWAKDGEEYRLIIKEGFECNLASVPRLVWWWLGPQDLGLSPPLFHDGLYACQGHTFDYEWVSSQIYCGGEMAGCWCEWDEGWSRYNADRLFGRLMRELRINIFRRRMAYRAVRIGGFSAWSGFRKGNEKP